MHERTETSIANMAADLLDVDAIGNIDEGFGPAKTFKRNYAEAVDTVVAEFSWNSATATAQLAEVVMPERAPTDYHTAYALPTDCVEPITINGRPCREIFWEIKTIPNLDGHGNVVSRKRVILCDFAGGIFLEYKCRPRPQEMSAHLAKAIAIELAIRCCTKLTNSTSKMQQLQVDYADATKGSIRRVGGYQVDSRANNAPPSRQRVSSSARFRSGYDL